MHDLGFTLGSGFSLAFRLCLGVTFAYASTSKLRDPRGFGDAVVQYELVPPRVARVVAFVMLPVELFLAAALIGGWLLVPALLIALAVIATFVAAVALNLRRGRRIPCGCFGAQSEAISSRTLARLAVLASGAVAAVLIAAGGARQWSLDLLVETPGAAGRYFLEIIPLGLLLAVASAWLLHVPELLSLVSRSRRSRPRREGVAGIEGGRL